MKQYYEAFSVRYKKLPQIQKMIIIIICVTAITLILAFSLNKKNVNSISHSSNDDLDISGTWFYKYGTPGYEPTVKIELEIMDGGNYYLSIKNMENYSVERGSWSVYGNVLQLRANNGNSKTCSFSSRSIRYGRYYLDKQ